MKDHVGCICFVICAIFFTLNGVGGANETLVGNATVPQLPHKGDKDKVKSEMSISNDTRKNNVTVPNEYNVTVPNGRDADNFTTPISNFTDPPSSGRSEGDGKGSGGLPMSKLIVSFITCAIIVAVFISCYLLTMANLCVCKFLMNECPTGKYRDDELTQVNSQMQNPSTPSLVSAQPSLQAKPTKK